MEDKEEIKAKQDLPTTDKKEEQANNVEKENVKDGEAKGKKSKEKKKKETENDDKGNAEEADRKGEKKKKKKKEKDGAKEKLTDSAKIKQKIEKIDAKMAALTEKKTEMMKMLKETGAQKPAEDTGSSNSSTITAA